MGDLLEGDEDPDLAKLAGLLALEHVPYSAWGEVIT
jgi:hypothetical protein